MNCRTVVSLTGSHPPPSLAAHEVVHPALCVTIGFQKSFTKTFNLDANTDADTIVTTIALPEFCSVS